METFTWKLELELSYQAWTDCTADVSLVDGDIEITDGFQSTSLVDMLANPGSISWVFDNSASNSAHLAGYYTPGHANCRSGFAKNIHVRYGEYYNSVWHYQAYWLQKPIPSAGIFGEAITRCRAVDWLEIMMNVPLPAIGVQTNKRADQLLTTLLAAVATQPIAVDFDTGDSTFASAFDVDDISLDSVYSILGKIARSEYGRIYIQPSTLAAGCGVLTFDRRLARLGQSSLGTISNEMEDAVVIDNAGEVYDRFQVQVTPRRVDTALVILATLNNHMYLAANEERTFTLNYVEQTSGNRISGKDIVTPVASTDYKFGTLDDGATEDMNANLQITMLRTGANASDIRLKNLNVTTGGYLNLFQLRGHGIYAFNPYVAEIGTGGLRVQKLDMPYQNDPLVANTLATYLKSISSDNTRRDCRVIFNANKSAALMTAAATGLINTRWTIVETQTALSGDFYIQGRRRTVSLGNRLDVEWLMMKANSY